MNVGWGEAGKSRERQVTIDMRRDETRAKALYTHLDDEVREDCAEGNHRLALGLIDPRSRNRGCRGEKRRNRFRIIRSRCTDQSNRSLAGPCRPCSISPGAETSSRLLMAPGQSCPARVVMVSFALPVWLTYPRRCPGVLDSGHDLLIG